MGLFGAFIDFMLTGDIGRYGEALTEIELGWAKLFGKKGRTLRNIYLPTDDGGTSEIDLIYITQKGIFVIESKNYSGWIFGDEFGQYWTQSLPNKQKNRFYNPVRQNRTHIKWLKTLLGEEVFCYSLIVFSNRCELKKVSVKSENLRVIHREELSGEIIALWKQLPDVLSDEQISAMFGKLSELTNADEAVKQAHIARIQAAHPELKPPEPPQPAESALPEAGPEPPASEPEPPKPEPQEICPKCGAKLILRTAKRGENAGKQFYGCSAFPKCRFIKNLEL